MVIDNINVISQIVTDRYALYNGDSCEVLKGIPDNSIHYSIFSPPFASLYTYSNSERDLGNCRTTSEFYEQFMFIVSELYRVLMPGRLISLDLQDGVAVAGPAERRHYWHQRFSRRTYQGFWKCRICSPFASLHLERPCYSHAKDKGYRTVA